MMLRNFFAIMNILVHIKYIQIVFHQISHMFNKNNRLTKIQGGGLGSTFLSIFQREAITPL